MCSLVRPGGQDDRDKRAAPGVGGRAQPRPPRPRPLRCRGRVLAGDLGIVTENTAEWWDPHERNGASFHAGQLVILDEASLAGTFSVDCITALAAEAGAKVLLVGDYAQLQSIDAGGAFAMLVHDRDDVPELVDVRRVTDPWEKTASLGLRHGQTKVIDTYIEHSRILGGGTEAMVVAAYAARRADQHGGKATVLVADFTESVIALSARARTDLILDGTVNGPREVRPQDGTRTAAGDTVITRRNDRRLCAGCGWVRTGNRWTVTAVHDDGSVALRRIGRRSQVQILSSRPQKVLGRKCWGTFLLPLPLAELSLFCGFAHPKLAKNQQLRKCAPGTTKSPARRGDGRGSPALSLDPLARIMSETRTLLPASGSRSLSWISQIRRSTSSGRASCRSQ
ncbi:AAA family ATPase [Sinomonas sp.]|uniref:AAA family ATPase n=1 Tax=Sinomonas sp. TaxID=1914986 RepID=UPI003F7E56BB